MVINLGEITHTCNFAHKLRSHNFYVSWGEHLIWESRCSVFAGDFGHLSDICQTWNWCTGLGDTLTRFHTHPLSVSLPSWLAWIFLLIPQLLSSCVCYLIIYGHNRHRTTQTPSAQRATESLSKNFIWHNWMKRNCKTGLFVYYWCVLTSHV